jgi:predicted enzyme related to lactoylglutathione lyase
MNANRNPVAWFEIYVQDMNRAKSFYENTFQLKLQRLESPGIELWAFPFSPENPGSGGALARMSGKESGSAGTIVYFSCDDCAIEAARAVQNGGRVHKGKTSIGQHGFIALLYDTEDNLIGLHSKK